MAEGIPPVSTRLIEKIRRWEFIDLAQLIGGADSSEGSSSMVEGHIVNQSYFLHTILEQNPLSSAATPAGVQVPSSPSGSYLLLVMAVVVFLYICCLCP